MEIKTELTYKGTRILFKETAKLKRNLINKMIDILESYGYEEMMIPVIQKSEIFASKVGDENQNMMYNFKDMGNRDLCLAPEYTAVVQLVGKEKFKYQKDIKLFYIGECFRGERPALGRWRQFTQLGIEIINPSKDYSEEILELSKKLIELITKNYEVVENIIRGLDYYKGWTMEIKCSEINNLSVCGGGSYDNGIGVGIGIDRLLLLS
jgi:histidyl-tRNA synthetase